MAARTRFAPAAPQLLPVLPIQPQVEVHRCRGTGLLPGLCRAVGLWGAVGWLVNRPHVPISGNSSHREEGCYVGWDPRGEGCLQGTLLWDVKATLRKRWRHKAEWRANILKDFFKKGPEITVAGMQGTAALDQSPNPTMLSLVWGNFSLYSTALCTLPSYILHAPGTQIQPERSLGHGSSPAFGSLWSTWGSQAQK